MPQAIRNDELFQPGILKPFRDELAMTTESAIAFSDSLLVVIKNQTKLAKSTQNNAKGYQELVEAEKKSISALNEKQKIDQKILKAQEAQTKVSKLQRERLAALNVETQRRNKIAKQEAQLSNENLNAYEKLQIKIKKLSDEYRGLIAVQGKETAQSRALKKEILSLNAIRDKSNEALGMHQHKVGQYERALGGLTRMLGQLGLAFGVFTLLKSTFGIITEFEKATASLSAITGATGDDLTDLKGKIIDLATEMKVSVIETTKLFEIVGSQMPQLLKDSAGLKLVSESAIILSKASGDTLENSTLAMASVMNQFSLAATESTRVMNILAAGSLVGSAGISDISEAMKNFGSVAAGANITVEESVALIEVLGKFGVVGAESGTKLRGSILKLQQASFGYASGQFEVNDALKEAKIHMDSLGTAMEKDAFLQKTFGAENISTGRILLSNIGLFEEYTKGVTGTSVATDQAAINSNTMTVVVKELKAAWENLVVKWSEGTDVLGFLKGLLRFIADNLETIVSWVLKGVIAWGSYRVALMLVNKEGTGFIQVLGAMGKNIYYNIKGMLIMGTTTKTLGGAMKGLGMAMKSIPFAGWVAILVSLVPLVIDFAQSIFGAEKEVKELSLAQQTLNHVAKVTSERLIAEEAELMQVFEALKLTKAGTKERQDALDEVNKKYGTTLKNLSDEAMFVKQLDVAYNELIATMEKRIRQEVVKEDMTELIKKRLILQKQLVDLQKQNLAIVDETNKTFTDFNLQEGSGVGRSAIETQMIFVEDEIARVNEALNALKMDVEGTPLTLGGIDVLTPGGTGDGTGKEKIKTQAELNSQLWEDIKKQNAENLLIIENEMIKSGATKEEIEKAIAERRLTNLNIENEMSLKLFGEFSAEFLESNLALNKQLSANEATANKDSVDAKKKYYDDLVQTQEDNLLILENNLLMGGKSRKEIDAALDAQRIENLKELDAETLRLFGEFSPEYIQAHVNLNNALLKEDEDAEAKKKEIRTKAMEALQDAFKELLDTLTESMERQNSLIDRQIEKQEEIFGDAKDREAELRQIAEERGLNATESIEAERDAQKKAKLEIERLEEKKRELELTIAVMKLLADGKSVADIKQSVTDVLSFAKNLPTFYEGTPFTVADSLGATHTRDGHQVRVDDGEAIFTGKQTRALDIRPGGNSTQDIVDMVKGGIHASSLRLAIPQNLQMMPQINSIADSRLANKLDQVIENTRPENQPVSSSNFNSIVGYIEHDYKSKLRREKVKYFIRKKH